MTGSMGHAASYVGSSCLVLHGRLDQMSVADVLQWLCTLRRTGVLTVDGPAGQTHICVEDGKVIHAEDGVDRGEAALMCALPVSRGIFAFVDCVLECERTILSPIEALVLQAAIAEDTARHRGGSEGLARVPSAACTPLVA